MSKEKRHTHFGSMLSLTDWYICRQRLPKFNLQSLVPFFAASNICHGEITPRKETFVQSRVYDVIRDSREHVEKRRRIRTAMLA